MSLTYISQQLTIYCGSILLFAGVIGNGINIFIFSSIHTYRRTPCTFYFLTESIFKYLYIVINLTIRIISAILVVDLTHNSIIWCKAHSFLIGLLSLTSLTCSSLATIDQFFRTSKNISLRRLSNIKWAHRFVFIIIIVWSLHGVPVLKFYKISPVTNKCKCTNRIYAVYVTIYILGLLCIIPILTMIIFGCLTYRNIRLTRLPTVRHIDRQLTRMTLIQVVLVVISIVPFGINHFYDLITAGMIKDAERQRKEGLATTVFILISYLYYVGNFYIFLISSKRFRQTVKERIFCWRKNNRIIPLS